MWYLLSTHTKDKLGHRLTQQKYKNAGVYRGIDPRTEIAQEHITWIFIIKLCPLLFTMTHASFPTCFR